MARQRDLARAQARAERAARPRVLRGKKNTSNTECEEIRWRKAAVNADAAAVAALRLHHPEREIVDWKGL